MAILTKVHISDNEFPLQPSSSILFQTVGRLAFCCWATRLLLAGFNIGCGGWIIFSIGESRSGANHPMPKGILLQLFTAQTLSQAVF